ncbi:MAG: hypothetical protein JNJ83_01545 [Verrucomicrobiaceae bacterium]|nr:hypothetical protein [Verrucomicrobiaceae bacterium]
MLPKLRLSLLLSVYLLSGAAALIYQLVWQRMAIPEIGGDVTSMTVIVAAFMTGLGLGSFVGGMTAERMSPRTALVTFGALELLIAGFGWFSRDASLLVSTLADSSWVNWFALATIPTLMMGMALPFVVRCSNVSLRAASLTTGFLYSANTAGAALGAMACTWALLPLWGLDGAISVAAGINLTCALSSLILSALPIPDSPSTSEDSTPKSWASPSINMLHLCALYSLVGFLAIGLEIIWFRSLGAMAKSTGHTLGTLLAVYLSLTAVGSIVGSIVARRLRSTAIVLMLLGIAAITGSWGVPIALDLIVTIDSLQPLENYLASYEPVDANTALELWRGTAAPEASSAVGPWTYPIFHFVIPFLLMMIPIGILGASFPILHSLSLATGARAARSAGFLMAANIIGCIAGSLLVTLILLPAVGTGGCLRLFSIIAVVFCALATWICSARLQPLGYTLAALSTAGVFAIPENGALWASIHGAQAQTVTVREDAAGVAAVVTGSNSIADGGRASVYVNGIGQSWIPFGGIHTVLGILPTFIHPHPTKIAVIGLGSGDTLHALLGREQTKTVHCIEIIASQPELLRAFNMKPHYAPLKTALASPKVKMISGDGRKYLADSEEKYDIIEADAVRPTSAHANALYSREFFELVLARLNKGGLAVSWAPSDRVIQTFAKVFPHMMNFGNLILVGSPDPILLNRDVIHARVRDLYFVEHFKSANMDIEKILMPVISQGAQIGLIGPDFDRSGIDDINTDMLPRDELAIPALWGTSKKYIHVDKTNATASN